MLPDVMNALIMSFIATIGFAGLLHAPVRGWIPASLIGAAGYLLYWALLRAGWTDPAAIFAGSCAASLLAQITARKMRMIASVFSILAIIPCVPGYGLYQTMYYIGQGESAMGLDTLIATMSSILMLAMGMAVGSSAFRFFLALKKRG